MKFVRKMINRTKSLNSASRESLAKTANAAAGGMPGLQRTLSMDVSLKGMRESLMSMPSLQRTKSLDASSKSSRDMAQLEAETSEELELFAKKEEATIESADELHAVIEALALAQQKGESTATAPPPMDSAMTQKRIATVKEFWRLINAQDPQGAYALVEDDIVGIAKHWDVIYPQIQTSSRKPLHHHSSRMARVA